MNRYCIIDINITPNTGPLNPAKSQQLDTFIQNLKHTPEGPLFNPWYHRDEENDRIAGAPEIRKNQFRTYLNERLRTARYLFIAEALGYQGGHFTGIAMTSERILLGHQKPKYGVGPEDVFRAVNPARTSRNSVNQLGMSEPTATIMWGALKKLGINTYETVLWNAVPWHPYNSEKGLLSNRTPTAFEMEKGLEHLQEFLNLFPGRTIIAVGRKCEECLNQTGNNYIAVRHPANGGAPKFRKQVAAIHYQDYQD